MSPQYASSSDTVREIKYQILHLNPLGISNLAARLAPSVGCAT
jgi:hypothetical protein